MFFTVNFYFDNISFGSSFSDVSQCCLDRQLQIPSSLVTPIWIAAGVTDMCYGFHGLAAKVETALAENPFSGQIFVFRGRRGDIIKVLWSSGNGLCLLTMRLERGRFVWPQATEGAVCLTLAQLSMLLEGIDWRRPERTWQPKSVL